MSQQEIDFNEPSTSRILMGFSGSLCLSDAQLKLNNEEKTLKNKCNLVDVECALTYSTAISNTSIANTKKPVEVVELIQQHTKEAIKTFFINGNFSQLSQNIKIKSGLFPDNNNNICALVNLSGVHLSFTQWHNFQLSWKAKIIEELLVNKNSLHSPSFFIAKSFDQWALQDLGAEKNLYAKQLANAYKKKFA